MVHEVYNIEIYSKMTWSTLDKALSKIFGYWDISNSIFLQYLQSIKDSNPRLMYKITINNLHLDGSSLFTGVFWGIWTIE